MQSTRIALSCFPRPRFELGLSSRVPQASAKRARLSCPIRSRLLDHPSQRGQPWPVNTTSIIAIRRMSGRPPLRRESPRHRLHRSRTSHLSSSRSYWTILGSRKRRFPNKVSNPFAGSLTFVIIWSTRSFVCIISINASCLARLF